MLSKLFYSFPIQLVVNHLKKNQALLVCWLILFAIVSGNFGKTMGIPYLFLDAEYLNEVNFLSFLLLGLTLGGFIMAFHISSYILDGHRFGFLGTVTKPFLRFAFNNSLIPLAFLIYYIVRIVRFQIEYEFNTPLDIITKISGLLLGCAIIIGFVFTYFRLTNKDIFKILASNMEKRIKKVNITRANVMHRLDVAKATKFRVDHYLDFKFRLRKAHVRSGSFYKEAILKVFDQNHLNSVIIELFIFVVLLLLGIFRNNPYFQIPAAASGILLFTIFVMFTGAISFWFRGWSLTVVIVSLILLNIIVKYNFIDQRYYAFGLNYNVKPAEYSSQRLHELVRPEHYKEDIEGTIQILENWKAKFKDDEKKPKMILICASGGGQRAALWTMTAMQKADSITQGGLMKNTMLISGASGGLVGAAYFRELSLRHKRGEINNLYDPRYLNKISSDNLNSIIFSLLIGDIFIRYQKFEYNGHKYLEDRGHAFENQLNKNTDFVMNKMLFEYHEPELKSEIPMLLLSPTSINDGRKLYISPHSVSYLCTQNPFQRNFPNHKLKGIDFKRFMKHQGADSMSFLTALRMSATFPFITPNAELPSDPPLQMMDAGLADNFGITDAVRFLYVFRDWISTNTSGVILLSIRDSEKNRPVERQMSQSMTQRIFNPIRTLSSNWDEVQDSNNDTFVEFAKGWFEGNLDRIELEYNTSSIFVDKPEILTDGSVASLEKKANERASLSWRLTTKEKRTIMESIKLESNQQNIRRLKDLLEN